MESLSFFNVVPANKPLTPKMLGCEHRSGLRGSFQEMLAALEELAGPLAMSIIEKYPQAYIAGGLVEKAISSSPHMLAGFSDVDIFIVGSSDEQRAVLASILRGLPAGCYFSYRAGAIEIYRAGERMIQLVVLSQGETIEVVLKSFDFDHISAAYGSGETRISGNSGHAQVAGGPGQFTILEGTQQAIATGKAQISRSSVTPKRCLKVLMSGYEISNAESMLGLDRFQTLMEAIVRPLEHADLYLYSLESFRIPRVELPARLMNIYMLGMVRKLTPAANIITDSCEDVIRGFTPGGLFNGPRKPARVAGESGPAEKSGKTKSSSSQEKIESAIPAVESPKDNSAIAPGTTRIFSGELVLESGTITGSRGEDQESSSGSSSDTEPVREENKTNSTITGTSQGSDSIQANSIFNPNQQGRFDGAGRIRPLACGCEDYQKCTHRQPREKKESAKAETSPKKPSNSTITGKFPEAPTPRVTEKTCEKCHLVYHIIGDIDDGCFDCHLLEVTAARKAARLAASKKL